MLHIKLNGITKCSNMVATILPGPMPLTWPIGQKSTFSEHCHVAYQIKENHECSNIVRDGVNRLRFNFSEYGHVNIKLKRITNAATW